MKKCLCVVFVLLSLASAMEAFAALSDDIVIYLSFSEGQGGKVKDSSKYGNNGEIVGNPKWLEGEHGGALEIDGATTMISVPSSDSLTSLKAPMTVGAILKVVEFPAEWQSLVCMYPNDNMSNNDRDNGWKCGFRNQNPTLTRWPDTDYDASNITLETDKWYYLVYVFDSEDTKFYLDGELKQNMPAPDLEGIAVNSPLQIGVEEQPGSYYTHTILDEFWVSNVEKSAEEIKEFSSPEVILSVSSKGKLAATWAGIKSD